MAIFAQQVFSGNPVAYTTLTGTSAQVVQQAGAAMVLNIGGAFLSGKPFQVVIQGSYKSHGTSQTGALGIQASAFSTSAFSGTQLGTGTASGTMTAGTSYPFYAKFDGFCDNTSGILSGSFTSTDGVTPTLKGGTITANLITGVTFGTSVVASANATNPLASAQVYALQFAPTWTNGVADTTAVLTVTSFYATTE